MNHQELNRKAAEIVGFKEERLPPSMSKGCNRFNWVNVDIKLRISSDDWNPAQDLNQIFKYLVPKLKGMKVVIENFDDESGHISIEDEYNPDKLICSRDFNVFDSLAPTLLTAIIEAMEKIE